MSSINVSVSPSGSSTLSVSEISGTETDIEVVAGSTIDLVVYNGVGPSGAGNVTLAAGTGITLITNEGTTTIAASTPDISTQDISSLLNVNASNPSSGQLLQWSGTEWVAATLNIPDDAPNFSDLPALSLGNASGGSALTIARADHVHPMPTFENIADTATQSGYAYATASGKIVLDASTGQAIVAGGTLGSGQITLNCDQNTHGVTLQGPPHSANATYTLTLPSDTGTAGQVLMTSGASGGLSWQNMTASFAWQTPPLSQGTTGVPGQVAYDAGYFYINTIQGWKRAPLSWSTTGGGGTGGGGTITTLTFTLHPQSQTVKDGDTVSLRALVDTATIPDVPAYQWQVKSAQGLAFADVNGSTGATYTFTAAESDDGNVYRCKVTSAALSVTTSSDQATLTVEVSNNIEMESTDPIDAENGDNLIHDGIGGVIQIARHPASIDLRSDISSSGTNHSLNVAASSTTQQPLFYHWFERQTAGGSFFPITSAPTEQDYINLLSRSSSMNDYAYHVVVSSSDCPSVTSNEATIQVADVVNELKWESSHEIRGDIDLLSGETVQWPARASGPADTELFFERSSDDGATWVVIKSQSANSSSGTDGLYRAQIISDFVFGNGQDSLMYRYRATATAPESPLYSSEIKVREVAAGVITIHEHPVTVIDIPAPLTANSRDVTDYLDPDAALDRTAFTQGFRCRASASNGMPVKVRVHIEKPTPGYLGRHPNQSSRVSAAPFVFDSADIRLTHAVIGESLLRSSTDYALFRVEREAENDGLRLKFEFSATGCPDTEGREAFYYANYVIPAHHGTGGLFRSGVPGSYDDINDREWPYLYAVSDQQDHLVYSLNQAQGREGYKESNTRWVGVVGEGAYYPPNASWQGSTTPNGSNFDGLWLQALDGETPKIYEHIYRKTTDGILVPWPAKFQFNDYQYTQNNLTVFTENKVAHPCFFTRCPDAQIVFELYQGDTPTTLTVPYTGGTGEYPTYDHNDPTTYPFVGWKVTCSVPHPDSGLVSTFSTFTMGSSGGSRLTDTAPGGASDGINAALNPPTPPTATNTSLFRRLEANLPEEADASLLDLTWVTAPGTGALNWQPYGAKVVGSQDNSYFSGSMDASSDGSIVVVSAPEYDVPNSSGKSLVRAYSYSSTEKRWVQLGNDITSDNINEAVTQLAISGDGSTIVTGSYLATTPASVHGQEYVNAGMLRAFEQDSSGNWVQKGSTIYPAAQASRGSDICAISSDGNTIAYAEHRWAQASTTGSGALGAFGRVRIFEFVSSGYGLGSNWSQVGSEIIGRIFNRAIGFSVDLSSDGSRVAIGSQRDGVRVYYYTGTDWAMIGGDSSGPLGPPEGVSYTAINYTFYGTYVDLSSDGNRLLVTAYNEDVVDATGATLGGAGVVRIYELQGSSDLATATWSEIDKIEGTISNEALGYRSRAFSTGVRLSGDGNTVVVGSGKNGVDLFQEGITRVFVWDGSNFTQTGSDIVGGEANLQEGRSVAVSSDGLTVFLGTPFDGVVSGGVKRGSFKPLVYDNTDCDIDAEFTVPSTVEALRIEYSANVEPATVQINNSGEGFVYSYDQASSLYVEDSTTFVGTEQFEGFGGTSDVSGDGTVVAFGLPFKDLQPLGVAYTDSGEVRVYNVADGSSLGSITNPATDGKFGSKLSLNTDGTRLAISQIGRQRVYLYEHSVVSGENVWTQLGPTIVSSQLPTATATGALTGYDISLDGSGSLLAVGEPFFKSSDGTVTGRVQTLEYDSSSSAWVSKGNITGIEEAGHGVSLSTDGSRLLVASGMEDTGARINSGAGRLYEYDSSSNSWSQLGATVFGLSDERIGHGAGQFNGNAASLSGDGTRFALGAHEGTRSPLIAGATNKVYIYEYDSTLDEVNEIDVINGPRTYGSHVSLDSNGHTLVAAAALSGIVGANMRGSVFVSKGTGTDNATFSLLGQRFDGLNTDMLGSGGVALSDDGEVLVFASASIDTTTFASGSNTFPKVGRIAVLENDGAADFVSGGDYEANLQLSYNGSGVILAKTALGAAMSGGILQVKIADGLDSSFTATMIEPDSPLSTVAGYEIQYQKQESPYLWRQLALYQSGSAQTHLVSSTAAFDPNCYYRFRIRPLYAGVNTGSSYWTHDPKTYAFTEYSHLDQLVGLFHDSCH